MLVIVVWHMQPAFPNFVLLSSLDFAANFLDVADAGALFDVAFEVVGVRLHGYATVVTLRARVCLNPSKNQEEPH